VRQDEHSSGAGAPLVIGGYTGTGDRICPADTAFRYVHIESYKRPLFVFGYITNWLVIPVSKPGYALDSVHTVYIDRNQMLPKPGQTCSITYHTSFTDGGSTPFGNVRIPNKIMDNFACKTT
jgi:hypothetical protein